MRGLIMSDDFIFRPTGKTYKTQTYYYCLIGNEDNLDQNGFPVVNKDSKLVLAKRIDQTDASPQYYIKISHQNKLFNPLDSGLEDRSYSIVDNVCRPSDKFKSVNSNVFNMYLKFLSSKNTTWLNKAEREMI